LGFWSKPKDSPSYTGLFCIAAMEINADTCEKKAPAKAGASH
jgi:hypothetical protein